MSRKTFHIAVDVGGLLGERRRRTRDERSFADPDGTSPTSGRRLGRSRRQLVDARGSRRPASRTMPPARSVRSGPPRPAQRATQPQRDDVGDRRADEGGDLQERRDVADRDVERAGDDVLRAAEEQHGDERDGGARRRPCGTGASRGRSRRWCSRSSLVSRRSIHGTRNSAGEDDPGDDHAGVDEVVDHEAERPGLPRREQPQRPLEEADVPVGLRVRRRRGRGVRARTARSC